MLCHIPYSTLKNALKKDTELSNLTIEKICQSLGIPFYQFFMSEKDWADLGAEIREKAWAKQDQRGHSQPCTPS